MCKMYKVVETDASPGQRSVLQLVKDLLILSRFHKYNPWLAVFSGVWATLLAGANQIATHPASISADHIVKQTLLCLICGYIFCGAGMVWNDWIDRNIDKNVARTKNRPLAAGRVTATEGFIWMMVHVAAMIPVTISTILYPFGKRQLCRRLYIYPQYFLGFSLAWPGAIGWMAIKGRQIPFTQSISESLPLSITVFTWTLYLNTAYSYQDVVDDSKMNVNSAYVAAGSRIHMFLVILAGLVLGSLYLQLRAQNSGWLWASWMCVWALSFVHQLLRFDAKKPESGGPLHKENFALGVWTIVACAAELGLSSGMADQFFSNRVFRR
ncbi:prenyltransferase spyF [Aspergillus fumigatus Af293]